MKRSLLFLCFQLSASILCAQFFESVHVIHRSQKYWLTKTCYDFVVWEEIRIRNKKVEQIVNKELQNLGASLQLRESLEERCKKEVEYSPECKIVYSKNGLLTTTATYYLYFKGAPHGERYWEVVNFDLLTGRKINFEEFISKDRKFEFDQLLIKKLQERLSVEDIGYLQHYVSQFNNPFFRFTDKGIDIDFIGPNYASSIIDVSLGFEELRGFLNKGTVLERFY